MVFKELFRYFNAKNHIIKKGKFNKIFRHVDVLDGAGKFNLSDQLQKCFIKIYILDILA